MSHPQGRCLNVQCGRCYSPLITLVCSGCGETYPANDIEGRFHDHWTAAPE